MRRPLFITSRSPFLRKHHRSSQTSIKSKARRMHQSSWSLLFVLSVCVNQHTQAVTVEHALPTGEHGEGHHAHQYEHPPAPLQYSGEAMAPPFHPQAQHYPGHLAYYPPAGPPLYYGPNHGYLYSPPQAPYYTPQGGLEPSPRMPAYSHQQPKRSPEQKKKSLQGSKGSSKGGG
jgi:hypothetical protein